MSPRPRLFIGCAGKYAVEYYLRIVFRGATVKGPQKHLKGLSLLAFGSDVLFAVGVNNVADRRACRDPRRLL